MKRRHIFIWFFLFVLIPSFLAASVRPLDPRQVINFDGTWQVAEGSFKSVPQVFDRTVPVPGLITLAEPAFAEVGKKSDRRQAFWYRRTFKIAGAIPEFAILKIHKAKYGTKVYLNGKAVGEHAPCFTPGYFDLKPFLKEHGRINELVVRVGADREAIPQGQPSGFDFEKYLFIPGIYDEVELILNGAPFIENVQIVPLVESHTVRVVVEIRAGSKSWNGKLYYSVGEKESGNIVGSDSSMHIQLAPNQVKTIDNTIPLRECRLWSPEHPFLYNLQVRCDGDGVEIPFGMRSFRFDRLSGRAVLNGKPYIMRGTNVCIFRFFEDSLCLDKPWRTEWVRRLHEKFKSMHWNSIRYCIGFPPEKWYDIADEVGFLIQDEFPIWLLSQKPENPQADVIAKEYVEWMRERWNHPCVVIWDAQNESVTPETGKAIQQVRFLDLSNRPWENGWAPPTSVNDVVESHPYLFIRGWQDNKDFYSIDRLAAETPNPWLHRNQVKYSMPVLINEYGWLWLNRDGTPTTLTKNFYRHRLGENVTAEERFDLYARYLAALTEFWRSGRHVAGVLHFCGLGYARSGERPRPEGGATSDHFIDLEKLTFEPHFKKYVRDAFSPVGLMLDFWQEEVHRGVSKRVNISIVNDLDETWHGPVTMTIAKGDSAIVNKSIDVALSPLGKRVVNFTIRFPRQRGVYELKAESMVNGERIESVRKFMVKEESTGPKGRR